MAAVQLMCARLGLVTGRGLAGVIRKYYPRWVLLGSCAILVVANVCNIGADLAGMSEACALVTPLPAQVWTPLFAIGIVAGLVLSSYKRIAQTFKYLTLVLFAYVGAALFAHPSWRDALAATLVPHFVWSRNYLSVLVAILGTTISPYLFFWQASQEVEEERESGKTAALRRRVATAPELRAARNDVLIGMFFSNLIMYFIILTGAASLHAHGIVNIDSAQQAAEALRPFAGNAAYILFTLGIVGTGVLAVPVLAGSCAYAISEASAWRASINARPSIGKKFYGVIAFAVILGLALDFVRMSPVRMLFLSAVLNGILAPPLIVVVALLTSNPKVMGNCTNTAVLKVLGWACAILMTIAVVAMLFT